MIKLLTIYNKENTGERIIKELMLRDLAIDILYMWDFADTRYTREGCFLVFIKNVNTNKKYMCYMPPHLINRGCHNKLFVYEGDDDVWFLKLRNGLDY